MNPNPPVAAREFRLVYNDDFEQPMVRARQGQAAADIAAWFDSILETPVDTLVGCAIWTDIGYHNTRVGERLGSRPGQSFPSVAEWHWQQIIRELEANGTDVLRLASESARRHGRRFLCGVRVSDAHHAFGAGYPADPRYPQFVQDHPEYRLRKPEFLSRGTNDESDVTLDYSVPAVRDHRLAIIREAIENYDLDGVELDFIRFGRHFPYPATADHQEILTGFIRQVRSLLDEAFRRRGRSERPIIGARLPPALNECAPRGLDPGAWARAGLVDYIVPSDFLFADFQVPLADYRAAVRETRCRVLYSLQPWSAPQWSDDLRLYAVGFPMAVPEFRALAATGYAAGADGMHAFNLSCEFPGRQATMLAALSAVASPASLRAGPRHYQYFPNEVAVDALGTNRRQTLRFNPANQGRPQVFRFRCGAGEAGRGQIIWRIYNAGPGDRWQFAINGQPLDSRRVRSDYRPADFVGPTALRFQAHMRFDLDLRDAPPLGPANELAITPLALVPGYEGDRRMELLEVRVGD